jgi:outer membrane biosynthesis protein TonB
MSRTRLAALTLLVLAACGRGDNSEVASADSATRDLQLAPVDTSAALNDRPSADTAMAAPATPAPAPTPAPSAPKPAAKPKPKPAAPAPAPTPAPAAEPAPAAAPAPAARSLAAGASFSATTDAEIRSNKNKVGDQVTATVAKDVKDAAGRVVIPAGSQVTLQVTAIKESENKGDSTGTLTLKPTTISINGVSQALPASISGVKATLQGRSTNAGDIAKVGAGTAVGAVVGRVIGGSTKGAIIGGIIGGAVGTQRAVETKDRDVVLPQGTTVTLTLDDKLVAGS